MSNEAAREIWHTRDMPIPQRENLDLCDCCERIAALELQLAEAQEKLDAVKRVESALRHAGNPSPDTKVDRIMWADRLARIFKEEKDG